LGNALSSLSPPGIALTASANGQVVAPLAAVASSANQQIVTPDPVNPVTPGSPVAIRANYTTEPANGSLTVASVVPASQPTAVASDSTSGQSAAPLTTDQLRSIVNEAIDDLANVGLSAATLDKLRSARFSITDLPGSQLGWTENDQVILDRDAAGYGWFVDPTPAQDEEFQPVKVGRQLQAVDLGAIGRMDLLTVVEHELGHIAGLLDLDSSLDDLMSSSLSKGIRRKVSLADIDAVFAAY
jgi:hypothetical protein